MLKTNKKNHSLNFLSLASILSASVGIPFITTSIILAKQYSPSIAMGSIFIGNLILWIIGITIISMCNKEDINGIQNIKNYIGKLGSIFISIVLLFCFLNWIAFQLTTSVINLKEIAQNNYTLNHNILIRIGAALGLFSALLSVGGIHLLKWISLLTLSLLFTYLFYAVSQSPISIDHFSLDLAFPAILMTTLSLFPGMINLPTIFRHSRSSANSYFGLTCFVLCISLIEFLIILINSESQNILINKQLNLNEIATFSATIIIITTSICNILVNIYFASACYETFSPHFSGTKGHAIIGLLGTSIYAFTQISAPLELLLDLFNSYLTSLATVLLISFLIRLMVKHRPRPLEKWINFLAWLVGCVSATFAKLPNPQDEVDFLLIGIFSSILFFLIVIFFEETLWSIQKLRLQKSSK